jgi:hypothetical protein
MINLKETWVDNAYDLSSHEYYNIVGRIPVDFLNAKGRTLFRPRMPLKPEWKRKLPSAFPVQLKYLYDIAVQDLANQEMNADHYYLYALYQTGEVLPQNCLRADFWHFDLMRNLRANVPADRMSFSIGYSVMNALPTLFAKNLRSFGPSLPARATIENEEIHQDMGEWLAKNGQVKSPKAGDVVRYDSMTLHRGRPNASRTPIQRIFMNLSFTRHI